VHRKSVKKGFEFTLMVVGKADAFAFKKQKAINIINMIPVSRRIWTWKVNFSRQSVFDRPLL
jgi:hypothetical protein